MNELRLNTILLIISVILLFTILFENIFKNEMIIKTNEEACKKVCSIMYNSSEFYIDNQGNCLCNGKMYIISGGKTWEIEVIKNVGVIMGVREINISHSPLS